MKKILIILNSLLLIFLTNCSILDFDERAALDGRLVFEGPSATRNFLYSIYESLPMVNNYIDGAMLECATDDAEFVNEFSSVQRFNTGNITVSYNPDNQWKRFYTGIRKCNAFLANATIETLDEYKYNLIKEKDGTQYYPTMVKALEFARAEARFLRAFFYFELIKRYGGVPLINDLDIVDIDAGSFDIPRNSFGECKDFIVRELDAIIPVLPNVHDDRDGLQSETGRVTKGAAMALKSRLLLYSASPLFNSSNDNSIWKQAASAAYSVIEFGQYALEQNYDQLFLKHDSRELIFERRVENSNSFERANYPIGYDGGNSGTCPSQNLVDAYEMQESGFGINESNSGYDEANPYLNRDPRFYSTIIYNMSSWAGRNVEIWEGGRDAPPIQNATKTGYYLKKYLNPSVRIGSGENIVQRHTWYLFRFGEIYLNLAEAMNEAYGPENDPDGIGMTALDAVNMIRSRAQMPDFPSGLSREEFRIKLRNERRIELAFENHRFWDIKRWKIGSETLGADLKGVSVERNNLEFTYSIKTVEKRVFDEKMNLYPIPYSETIKSNLEQNPGW